MPLSVHHTGQKFLLILVVNCLVVEHWIDDQITTVQGSITHSNRIDLTIFIGRVVQSPGCQVNPVRIDRVLKGIWSNLIQTLLLINRMKGLEVVGDVLALTLPGWCVHLSKGFFDKAAFRIHPAWQQVGTDPPTVIIQRNSWG